MHSSGLSKRSRALLKIWAKAWALKISSPASQLSALHGGFFSPDCKVRACGREVSDGHARSLPSRQQRLLSRHMRQVLPQSDVQLPEFSQAGEDDFLPSVATAVRRQTASLCFGKQQLSYSLRGEKLCAILHCVFDRSLQLHLQHHCPDTPPMERVPSNTFGS